MAERNTDRIRYRYGICLNDNCEKCKSKEVQEIPARKEFVCPECGKPLRECPPPKKGGNTKLIGIIAGVVVLLAIIGCIIAFSGGSEEKPMPAPVPEVKENTDSIKAAQEAAEQQRIKDSLDAVAAAEAAKEQETEKTAFCPAHVHIIESCVNTSNPCPPRRVRRGCPRSCPPPRRSAGTCSSPCTRHGFPSPP